MIWTTLTGANAIVVHDDRLLMIRQRRPYGVHWEFLDEALYADPAELMAEIHPLDRVILDRWWDSRATGFDIQADVTVEEDGTQTYAFR
ncbi:MAG TPA: hypothetical protein VFR32_08815 [Gaiellaceae bacterium]|nr:hypothetical protein [Gaiellaceae bacterium]